MANLKFWDFFGGMSPKRWHLVVVLDAASKNDFARYFIMDGKDYDLDRIVKSSSLKAFLLTENVVKGCLLDAGGIREARDEMDDTDDRLFIEKLPDLRKKTIDAIKKDGLGDLTVGQWLKNNEIEQIGTFSRIERRAGGLLPPQLGDLDPEKWNQSKYDYIMDTKLGDLKATGDLDISSEK